MRDIVKIMLRLQELELIQEEAKILPQDGSEERKLQLENLRQMIADLMTELPERWRSRYCSLRKNGVAVVREIGGVCQQCRMVISLGVLNEMRKGTTNWICPNCGRFLLLSEETVPASK